MVHELFLGLGASQAAALLSSLLLLAVGHTQPVPLVVQGGGQITHLLLVCRVCNKQCVASSVTVQCAVCSVQCAVLKKAIVQFTVNSEQ